MDGRKHVWQMNDVRQRIDLCTHLYKRLQGVYRAAVGAGAVHAYETYVSMMC